MRERTKGKAAAASQNEAEESDATEDEGNERREGGDREVA